MAPIKVIWRIIKFFFQKIPIESALSSLAYILENLRPAVMTLLSAALFGAAEGCLTGSGQTAKLYVYTAIMILYFVLYDIIRSLSSICINAGVYEKAMYLLRDHIAAATAALPLIQFEDEGAMARRKRAEECVQNDRIPGIFMLLIVLTTSIAGIVSLLAALWAYHPLLPPIAAASVAQFFVSNWLLERESFALEAAVTQGKRGRDYLWSLFTNLGNVREMRVMGFAGYLAGRWKEERDRVNEAQWRLDRKRSRYRLLCDAVKTCGYLTGVALCLWLLRDGAISAPIFGACLVAFVSVQDVVGNFFGSAGKIPGFVGLAADYFSFIDSGVPERQEAEAAESAESAAPQELSGAIESIELKDISFRYPHSEKEAVKAATLTIRQGQVVSLVGVNGSGKTTLVKLLLGVYEPERGEIRYNGKNLRTIRKESLYSRTALLTQDFALYNLSLEENIALADIDRAGDKERIRAALRRVDMEGALDEAQVWEDSGNQIDSTNREDRNWEDDRRQEGSGDRRKEGAGADSKIPGEYGRILGREFGGPTFSEGQKQRLALARVLFADRELVILDEPTSALDPLQENRILEEFLRLAKGRTTIIISHRVGLCRQVDKIAVMQAGAIAECGSHEELMAKGGEYRKLYDMQSRWYTEGQS